MEDWKPDADLHTIEHDETQQYQIRNNAFLKLETEQIDKKKAADDLPRIAKMIDIQMKHKDDYELNSLLRKRLREDKATIKEQKSALDPNNIRSTQEERVHSSPSEEPITNSICAQIKWKKSFTIRETR
jgi:small-conductance mechanosensitive channel